MMSRKKAHRDCVDEAADKKCTLGVFPALAFAADKNHLTKSSTERLREYIRKKKELPDGGIVPLCLPGIEYG